MKVSQYKNKKRFQIVKVLYVTIVLLALTTVATYTWFNLSTRPSINDMSIYINSGVGLELSLDKNSEEWSSQIDFRELEMENTPLVPITYSQADNSFYTVVHGADGRIASVDYKIQPSPIPKSLENNGYYLKVSFFGRTDEDIKVYLSPAVELERGTVGAGTWLIGAPTWDGETVSHKNGGGGAEYAMRVGINITYLNELGNSTGNSVFYMYEPNYDGHLDGSTGYVETKSVNGDPLINEQFLIKQTKSTWRDADLVQKNVISSDLGTFDKEPLLFEIDEGEMVQIELYFWLEGQDIDCGNLLNEQCMIMSNIQFRAETEGSSELRPIY